MNGRIAASFEKAASTGQKVLVPFITAGDPEPGWTVAIMHALVAAGADLLELGVPFSDPAADGPVIQEASERAIQKHVDLHKVLSMVEAFRSEDKETPVVLMGYMNPVERFGRTRFPQAAKQAGVDGLWPGSSRPSSTTRNPVSNNNRNCRVPSKRSPSLRNTSGLIAADWKNWRVISRPMVRS